MIDQAYIKWLYSFIGPASDTNPSRTYHLLAETMMEVPFSWSLPMDQNRSLAGENLRNLFIETHGFGELGGLNHFGPCSFLELVVSLALEMAYQIPKESRDHGASYWLWEILGNLDFRGYTDDVVAEADLVPEIEATLTRVLLRKYRRSGHGGLFPLLHPMDDQRDVEIWYQMSAFLLEHDDGMTE